MVNPGVNSHPYRENFKSHNKKIKVFIYLPQLPDSQQHIFDLQLVIQLFEFSNRILRSQGYDLMNR